MISVLAFALSYKKFRHDTRPALIMRRISQGEGQWWDAIEIENVGQSLAVGVSLTLVERTKRPSGRLHVGDVLKPGESTAVSAFDWPDALAEELDRNTLSPMAEFVLKMDGRSVRPDSRRVAAYLLCRDGKQIVVLRFRVLDGAKTVVRLFSPVKSSKGAFTELIPVYRCLRNRPCAAALQRWYGSNAELAPPLKFPVDDESSAGEAKNSPG